MTVQLKVPSMVCNACVNTITQEIQTNLPNTPVTADLESKMVTVETQESEAKIKEMITAVGHEVA